MAAQKKNNPGKERRTSKRSAIELAASFGIDEDPRPEREAKINDVSGGGFCFTSDHKLEEDEELQLAVDLDVLEQVVINVRVVWVEKVKGRKGYRVGVRLIESDGPEFERFMEFYRKQI
ncbi:MAG: PilZ domain-containing protein [Candidatus Omnitrophica bacterium]|nr:PilZ domain-containing protein [Candidatus Omnitrophota bacterium]